MDKAVFSNGPADLDAGYYVEHSSLQNNLAKEILNTFPIDPTAHILDIGCGDGRITAELAYRARRGEVLGIDASPQMIEFAIKNFPHENFSNLRFLQGTAEEVKLPKSYDCIVSFSCFHWLKDPELVVRRLRIGLKPEGKLLILTYPKESPYYQYLEIALEDYPEYSLRSANHTMLSITEYEKILLRNQFNIFEFQERNLMASYNNMKEVQEYIKGWLSSYVPLPEALHDSFLQKVGHTILEDPKILRNEKIIIPYTALVIKAKK